MLLDIRERRQSFDYLHNGLWNKKWKTSLCALRFGVKYSADTLQKLSPEMDGNSQGLWSGSTWLFLHYGMFLC